MPSDFGPDALPMPDPPRLCHHCEQVIANLTQKDHVTDRDSERAAVQLARQCCSWRNP